MLPRMRRTGVLRGRRPVWRAAWRLAAGLWPVTAALAAPPDVNLRLELRWRQEAAAVAPGSVVIRSDGHRTDPQGPGTTWRTLPAETADLSPGGRLPQLTVRNGAAVRVALTQWRSAPEVEWRWRSDTGSVSELADSGAAGRGQAELRGRDARPADTARLELQPLWPGGPHPVRLIYRLNLPAGPATPAGPSAAVEGAGELLVPLGQWTPLGQWAPTEAGGRPGAVRYDTRDAAPEAAGGVRWLELRVSRP